MDRLPLALEQAAAYILATGGTLAEYVDCFGRGAPTSCASASPPATRGR
jgi:hypothetical protein